MICMRWESHLFGLCPCWHNKRWINLPDLHSLWRFLLDWSLLPKRIRSSCPTGQSWLLHEKLESEILSAPKQNPKGWREVPLPTSLGCASEHVSWTLSFTFSHAGGLSWISRTHGASQNMRQESPQVLPSVEGTSMPHEDENLKVRGKSVPFLLLRT